MQRATECHATAEPSPLKAQL